MLWLLYVGYCITTTLNDIILLVFCMVFEKGQRVAKTISHCDKAETPK